MKKQDILNAYQWRFACKEFDHQKKISSEDFDFLLEIIRLSPSSFGSQPFQVLVIKNQEIITELGPYVWGGKKQLPTASEVILFVTRKDIRHDSEFMSYMIKTVRNLPADMHDMYMNLIKQHQEVDFDLLTDERYLHDWAGKQAYIALGNLMSAAAEIGIDSCPIEGFSASAVTALLAKHDLIDPAYQIPCVFCALGYRLAPPAREKTRLSVNELIKVIK
jgi:nitroreductase